MAKPNSGSGGIPAPPTFTSEIEGGPEMAGIMSLDDIFGTDEMGREFLQPIPGKHEEKG